MAHSASIRLLIGRPFTLTCVEFGSFNVSLRKSLRLEVAVPPETRLLSEYCDTLSIVS